MGFFKDLHHDEICSNSPEAIAEIEADETISELYENRTVGFGPHQRLPRTVEDVFPNAKPLSEEAWQSYLNNSPDNPQEYEMVRRGE